ncbi:MAG: translation initiation factor IF-2 [Alphaproteobacteria bacterium]
MFSVQKTDESTLTTSGRKQISLKGSSGSSTVRQSLSHSRTKAVVVEKKRKRVITPKDTPAREAVAEAPNAAPKPAPAAAPAPEPTATAAPPSPTPAPEPVAKPEPEAKVEAPAAAEPAPASKEAKPVAEAKAPEADAPAAKANGAAPTDAAPAAESAPKASAPAEAKAPQARKAAAAPATGKTAARPAAGGGRSGTDQKPRRSGKGVVLKTLTEEEKRKRAAALSSARVREVEDRKRAEEEAKRRAEEEARLAVERAEQAKREAEEKVRREAEEEVKRKAEAAEQAAKARRSTQEAPSADRSEKTPGRTMDTGRPSGDKAADGDEGDRARRPGVRPSTSDPAKPAAARKGEQRRRTGKLTITQALDEDGQERVRSLASVKRARERERRRQLAAQQQQQRVVREVVIPEMITVQELANRMATRAVDIIKNLMKQGVMAKINDVIDTDTAQLIAEEYGHTVKRVSEADVEEGIIGEADVEEDQESRAPVVTIMGHVDHGKTSLLDALRQTDVVSGEAGGITQHIGAYQVQLADGQKISFLDTPGHAAFTQMRARGAKATDIVILVVSADDGVMPQTVEAINHAKAAEVPIIVAINKIDKPDANPDRVRQELLQHDIVVEALGGDVQDIEVSALKKMNLDKLQDGILLQSEIMELKANPNRAAEGIVIEAKLDRGRGPVGTVLIQRGTLKVGDIFVAGAEWGRVRALLNDKSAQVESAGPSVPVEILGFDGTPEAGDIFAVVENEARAREISDYRQRKRRENRVGGAGGRGSLEQMLAQLKEADKKEFPLVIKGDVQGSVEAIIGALNQLGTDEVASRPIHTAVGGITESDVILAAASNAPIIAFNVRANNQARDLAQQDGVEIRYYSVIYDLVDDVKAAMSGLLDPTLREHFLGNAEILEVFNISKVGKVAGCRVTEGAVKRGAKVRLIRDNVVIHEGTLSTLKRFKDEVKEVHGGQECGMAFENYQDLQAGDVIECFEVEEIQRTL